jgi:hypothetical protein
MFRQAFFFMCRDAAKGLPHRGTHRFAYCLPTAAYS